ncbi:MAG: methionyl-tRNA formyltransferase [Bacilli bacterium]|nr:methionyl-tRNA formyltransferase [Bacilli bacterium]
MKVVFFGSPLFAVPSLERINQEHKVLRVITTNPSFQRGRLIPTWVEKKAIELRLPVSYSLEDIPEADVYVVVAFKILPRNIFSRPKKGTINLHAAFLPDLRGAAPIEWALIYGYSETGLTTFLIDDGVDTGKILLQEKVEILEEDNLESLYLRMSGLGSGLISKTLKELDILSPFEQSTFLKTKPAPKITKETGQIDWKQPAYRIRNLVRGYPGAWTTNGTKIWKTEIIGEKTLEPGIYRVEGENLLVGTGTTDISILEIQEPGKKRLKIGDYLHGCKRTEVL